MVGTLNKSGLVSIKRGSELLGYSEQAYHKREKVREAQSTKAESLQSIMRSGIESIREHA